MESPRFWLGSDDHCAQALVLITSARARVIARVQYFNFIPPGSLIGLGSVKTSNLQDRAVFYVRDILVNQRKDMSRPWQLIARPDYSILYLLAR